MTMEKRGTTTDNVSNCQKLVLQNCAKKIDYVTCEICDDGYYLSATKTCLINPEPKISDC